MKIPPPTPGIIADQLCYARQREWSRWYGIIDRLKLRNLIATEIRNYAETQMKETKDAAERIATLEAQLAAAHTRIKAERVIFRRALSPDNEPQFVKLWVAESAENERLRKALQFYADPASYFGVGFWPDPPCGGFLDDFSDTGDLGLKPGKQARAVLDGGKAE
jgi:hypothetical protein